MASISKTQVNRLGDRLRKGEDSDDDLSLLEAYRASFADAYEEVAATIRRATALDPTGRPEKTRFSIIQKLRRETTMQLSQMQDIAGCRVVVSNVMEQDRVVELLAGALARVRVYDRRKQPSHGYRAVHVIATALNKPVEIQVRTVLQDLWAQWSEVFADRIDGRIKYGGGNRAIQDILSRYSGYVANIEAGEGEHGGAELVRPGANPRLDDRKAQVRQSLDELKKIVESLPRRVN